MAAPGTTKTTPRRPRGTPVGGQFAPFEHPEADVELSDELVDQAMRKATKASSALARRYGVSAEDVRQDTLLAFVASVKRNGADAITNPNGYIETIARQQAVSAMIGTTRTEVRQAISAFHSRVAATSQLYGRDLTAAEQDEIAEAIRGAQPPRRRAPEGFHRKTKVVSLEDAGVVNLADVSTPATTRGFDEDSIAARAERLLAAGEWVAARRLAWDAVAESTGAPLVAHESVTETEAARCRRLVADAGGVTAVANAAAPGGEPNETERAVLAPFGETDTLGRDRVFDLLAEYPDVADRLWDVALTQATVTRKNKKAS